MGINMKGRSRRFLFLGENLSCVSLRKACDSVFVLTHPAADRDVFIPHPSSCCWPSPPLSCQDGSVELIQFSGLLSSQPSFQTRLPPQILLAQGGEGKEGAKAQTRKGQKGGRPIYRGADLLGISKEIISHSKKCNKSGVKWWNFTTSLTCWPQ